MVENDAFSKKKIDSTTIFLGKKTNLEGYPNCITGSKVKEILLKQGICLLVELHREGSAHAAQPAK